MIEKNVVQIENFSSRGRRRAAGLKKGWKENGKRICHESVHQDSSNTLIYYQAFLTIRRSYYIH